MTDVLGITPTDYSKTIIDSGHSLIEMGIVKKPKKVKKKETEKVEKKEEKTQENKVETPAVEA